MLELIQETAAYLKGKMHTQPETAIILGTGLGSLATEITEKYEIKYEEIPNFPVSTVEGHSGKLIFGKLGNKDIMAMQGRFHYYEEEILKQGLATPEEYETLEKYTLALFKRGTEIAAERGLILVDTKYEFGKHNGTIYLMDEIHTPDSSRYFYSDGYQERFEKGEPQKQLSKEFVREWLMENGFQGKDGQKVPEMTPAIVQSISDRYIELFENITGEKFVKEDTSNIAERIEKNVMNFLSK